MCKPQTGAIIVSPQSRGSTWDGIREGFGGDVELIDKALHQIFRQYDIDRRRVAIGGFSDGASYALSLGLINGQLFSHIIAFSPAFICPGHKVRLPAITMHVVSSCWDDAGACRDAPCSGTVLW